MPTVAPEDNLLANPFPENRGTTSPCKNSEESEDSESNLVVMAATPYGTHILAQTQGWCLRDITPQM